MHTIAGFILLISIVLPSPLETYRWEKRLILVSITDLTEAKEPLAALQRQRTKLIDRDLVVIDLSPAPLNQPHLIRPSDAVVGELRRHYGLTKKSAFILIGKDGQIKAEETADLDLPQLFALIDSMPMRKREIDQ